MPLQPSLVALLAVPLIACVAEPETVSELSEALECPVTDCPDNSPVVAGYPFHELYRHAVANRQGLRVTGFRDRDGRGYDLDVRDARLVGLDPVTGEIALDTAAMRGATITLAKRHTNGADDQFELVIQNVNDTRRFLVPPLQERVVTYRIQGYLPDGHTTDLCLRPKGATGADDDIRRAVLFAGERYDERDKTVTIGDTADGWFNLACVTSATAKMHFLRYTRSGQRPDRPVTPLEEQTMLKMLTATYCPATAPGGEAKAFTVPGEPLPFARAGGPLPAGVASYEGVWTPDGIACLEEPRLARTRQVPQPDADAILSDLDARCGGHRPPRCTDLVPAFPVGWESLGSLLSANPVE